MVTSAAVPKDGLVAYLVTFLQHILTWMQYRQDPYIFGEHLSELSFRIAIQEQEFKFLLHFAAELS